MELKICITFLLLLALTRGQSIHVKSYDWRTTGNLQDWPKMSSLIPFAVTESYPSIREPQPYHQPQPQPYPKPYHPDSSVPYSHEDSASYSQEYPRAPYHDEVPQSLSSYENYHDSRDEELNMTTARIGGFAGSGDTKGFGAYDFPKNHHQEPHLQVPSHPESGHPGPIRMDPEIEELIRLSSIRLHHQSYGSHDSGRIHPLPPPL